MFKTTCRSFGNNIQRVKDEVKTKSKKQSKEDKKTNLNNTIQYVLVIGLWCRVQYGIYFGPTKHRTGQHRTPHRTPQDLVRLLNSLLGVK